MSNRGEPIEPIFERLREDAGREEDFRVLFDRFFWPLLRFFERRGFSQEEGRDLVQETFLGVHRGIRTFRGEARWENWLFRIAGNTAGKAVRHRSAAKRAGPIPVEARDPEDRHEPEDDEDPGGPETSTPLRRLLHKEMAELLRRAIGDLPTQMRRCVWLRVYQDRDYDEIAELLQISPTTVKVQLFRARKRLQMELGDYFEDFDL